MHLAAGWVGEFDGVGGAVGVGADVGVLQGEGVGGGPEREGGVEAAGAVVVLVEAAVSHALLGAVEVGLARGLAPRLAVGIYGMFNFGFGYFFSSMASQNM